METKTVSTHWQDALICKSPTYLWLDFINCASNWCCPFQQMKMIHFMNIWGKACHFTDEYPWIMRESVFHLTVIYWALNQFVNKLSRMDSSPVSGGWFIFRLLVCRKCKGEQCCARKVRKKKRQDNHHTWGHQVTSHMQMKHFSCFYLLDLQTFL